MDINPADSGKIDTAQRILVVAEQLFGERGFNGVSTRDIAEAAGISKANVFHHYSSKAALYETVLRRSAGRFNQLLHQLAADQRPLPELLDDFSRQHLQNMLQHQNAMALFVRHLLNAGDSDGTTVTDNIIEQSHDLLMETFATLQQRGRLAEQIDPSVLALTLVGSHLAFALLRNMLARSGQAAPSIDAFSQALVKQLLDGVLPTPRLSAKKTE